MPGDPSTAWKVLLVGQVIEDPEPRLHWLGHLAVQAAEPRALHRFVERFTKKSASARALLLQVTCSATSAAGTQSAVEHLRVDALNIR